MKYLVILVMLMSSVALADDHTPVFHNRKQPVIDYSMLKVHITSGQLSPEDAKRIRKLAREPGNWRAKALLGWMFLIGEGGVNQSMIKAYIWYGSAYVETNQTYSHLETKLDYIWKRLNKGERVLMSKYFIKKKKEHKKRHAK